MTSDKKNFNENSIKCNNRFKEISDDNFLMKNNEGDEQKYLNNNKVVE